MPRAPSPRRLRIGDTVSFLHRPHNLHHMTYGEAIHTARLQDTPIRGRDRIEIVAQDDD